MASYGDTVGAVSARAAPRGEADRLGFVYTLDRAYAVRSHTVRACDDDGREGPNARYPASR
jgi:hypothetical protein